MVEDRICPVNDDGPDEELDRWASTLADDALDYLYAEALRSFVSDQQQFSALDSKIVPMVGWALIGIGTLLIAGSASLNWTAEGVATGVVVCGASVVLVAGIYALWPRIWASALDLRWYSKWENPSAKAMRARALAELTRAAEINRATLNQRSQALRGAAIGLFFEFAALIAVVVLANV